MSAAIRRGFENHSIGILIFQKEGLRAVICIRFLLQVFNNEVKIRITVSFMRTEIASILRDKSSKRPKISDESSSTITRAASATRLPSLLAG